MVRINQITSQAEIERLVPQWQALWQRVPNATPFQSPEWLLPWWSCFGNSAALLVAAYNDERLIGLLPLYLFEEPGCRRLLPVGISLSDYLDALLDPGYPGLVDLLLDNLTAVTGWAECHLPDLPPSAALLAANCPPMLSDNVSNGQTCPVLRLPATIEELRDVVRRKTLRDVRQARRRARSAGPLTVIRAEADTVPLLMDKLFRLHERRWKGMAGRGVCADPAARSFHLIAAERLCDAGMLRLYLLRIGGSPVAAYYGFTANHIAYAYLSGFDPDWAQLSPGVQIIAHAIEEAIREGAREFHFLRGGEAYKYAWGALDRQNTARTLRRWC